MKLYSERLSAIKLGQIEVDPELLPISLRRDDEEVEADWEGRRVICPRQSVHNGEITFPGDHHQGLVPACEALHCAVRLV